MATLLDTVEKVVVASGIGRISQQPSFSDKVLPELVQNFALLCGQKPALRTARASIAGFKVREGTVVGLAATLRGKRMRAFIDKLVKVVLPRVRDFRGIDPKNIDNDGNLNIGIRELATFAEIPPEKVNTSFGVQVTIVLKNRMDKAGALAFYQNLAIPFKRGTGNW